MLLLATCLILARCLMSDLMLEYVFVCNLQPSYTKAKVKYLGVPFGRAGHLSDHIFHASEAKLWLYEPELCTLSVTYPLCGTALTNTMDNPSEMCQLKLTDFCLFCTIDHTQSYKGRLFPPMAFISCRDRGSITGCPKWESQHSNQAATPTCIAIY